MGPGVRRDDIRDGDQVTRRAKIADDFAAKSADNALKFANPARDCRGFPFRNHREDHL
jgi:hypothetical protein